MAEEQAAASGTSAEDANQNGEKAKGERREIKGGIPYSTAPQTVKKALDLIVSAERPDKFSSDFMSTILKMSGGSARTVPPFLKKMQFIGPDGSPTILYSKFKTDGGRAQAAYEGLRNAFGELFRRNEYVHKADENAVKDIIVEITGLKRTDGIVRMMYQSFDAVRSFIHGEIAPSISSEDSGAPDEAPSDTAHSSIGESQGAGVGRLGISYQINVILPETENIGVFNAIFRSLRENLLR